MAFKLGDFVTVLNPSGAQYSGSGRIIDVDHDGEIYAVERDDEDSVTWHGADELRPE